MLDAKHLENLDAMDADDLVAYARKLLALQVDFESEDYVVRNQLINYAKLKATAMKARAKGTIASAMQMEKGCETIYKTLPEYARW